MKTFFLEITMILGGKYGVRRSIRSEAPNFNYLPLIGVAQNLN